MDKELEKLNAAKACIELIEDGMLIGIGSGSTVAKFIKLLGEKIKKEGINVLTIPTSYQVRQLLVSEKIPITSLEEHPEPDIAIDGADEVDNNLNLIKGGGAALTQEKIVDSSSKRLIIIVDSGKLVDYLGQKFKLPIEIIPMSFPLVKTKLKAYASEVSLRMAEKKLGPVITDNGNFILDIKIPDLHKKDLKLLEMELNSIPGVIENGLFIDMTEKVYVGYSDHTKILQK